ncbi:MAG: glycosyltransferase family 4 protein [Waterburya sp.]
MLKTSGIWSPITQKVFIQTLLGKAPTKDINSENFNLLIITQFYPPDFAPTGQLIQELANHLSQKNIQVNIFTAQPGYAFKQQKALNLEIENNVHIERTTITKFWTRRIRGKTVNGIIFTLKSAIYLLKNARQNNLVLLTTAPPFLSIIGYLANLFFKVDYACLVYDLYPDAVIELDVISANNLIARLWHKINEIVWYKSKKIIVLSETMKSRIVEQHPTIASKISVIHNWADADWIKPLRKQQNWFARKHGIDQQFTVLYSGNLGLCHDLETIVATIELLQDHSIRFVFIGAGTKHEICQQIVREQNLNNCLFLPYQDKVNLPYSLTACDLALVSIAPGLEGVVAPSKVYGIMAAGVAIAAICEPHSYLRPLIENAECGACFNHNYSQDLADFIIALAANPELAVSMGNAGRKYQEKHFTPQIISQQYCDALEINCSLDNLDRNKTVVSNNSKTYLKI